MRPLTLILSLLIAPAARADLSDSGNLNIGGNGVIAGTMTVQGNAFSVGGSTFSVSAGTVQAGGLLKVSAAGVQWADGSVSTTASSGNSEALRVSTQTLLESSLSGAGNDSSFAGCIAGSTVTMTISRNEAVEIGFSAPTHITGSSQGYAYLWVLVDGEFVSGEAISQAITHGSYMPNSSAGFLATTFLDSETPGTHSYCFGIGMAQNNTPWIDPPTIFYVRE
jgi:hypothetical protein